MTLGKLQNIAVDVTVSPAPDAQRRLRRLAELLLGNQPSKASIVNRNGARGDERGSEE